MAFRGLSTLGPQVNHGIVQFRYSRPSARTFNRTIASLSSLLKPSRLVRFGSRSLLHTLYPSEKQNFPSSLSYAYSSQSWTVSQSICRSLTRSVKRSPRASYCPETASLPSWNSLVDFPFPGLRSNAPSKNCKTTASSSAAPGRAPTFDIRRKLKDTCSVFLFPV